MLELEMALVQVEDNYKSSQQLHLDPFNKVSLPFDFLEILSKNIFIKAISDRAHFLNNLFLFC